MYKRGAKIRKAQSWSFDLIIAGIIFILVITIFYTLLIREPRADIKQLKQEGNYIANKLEDPSTGPCGFLNQKEVDPTKLQECFASQPEDFRRQHNIKSHFCIYFVDKDGRLITVTSPSDPDKYYAGFGYEDLELADASGTALPCGAEIETTPP